MKHNRPRVSVIMGVYNCASTVGESIESICAQSFVDWEMIVCDDGSSDGTLRLVREWERRDGRIGVLQNERNCGLAETLDRCIGAARGELLARQDGDDISRPDRFAKLVAAFDSNPTVAVVSSWMSCFDEHGEWGEVRTQPFPVADDFLGGTPICHAPCMMRRSVVIEVGGYGTEPWVRRVEDYWLWFRVFAAGYRAMNLQESLYRVRDDKCARSRRTFAARLNEARVRWRGFSLFHMSIGKRLWAIKPILVWMLPGVIYNYARRNRWSGA